MKKLVSLLLVAMMLIVPTMIHAVEAPVDVAVIIKATTSDFWQYVLVGAENYGKEFPDRVNITTYGPPTEADIDQQVSILEDVVSTNPKAIVISSASSDATIPALREAQEKGIVVITIDNRLNEDVYDAFLATNNYVGGGLAAQQMLDSWKELGIEPKGQVGIVNAMAGVQVLTDREQGFRDKMAEIAPEVELLQTRFTDNDMVKSITAAEDLISANENIIGFFGCNNVTGSGVARVISERELKDKIVGIAFDSDPEEINAVQNGDLKALILQDPYGMGYKGKDYTTWARDIKDNPRKDQTYCDRILYIGRHGNDPEVKEMPPASADYSPVPFYREPLESPLDPEVKAKYPLVASNGRLPYYHHSTLRNIPYLRETYPVPELWIDPDAAAERGIVTGDWVNIKSRRCEEQEIIADGIYAKAFVTKGIIPGEVYMERFWNPEFLEEGQDARKSWTMCNWNVLSRREGPHNPVMGTYTLRGVPVQVTKSTKPAGVWCEPEDFKPWMPEYSENTGGGYYA